MYEFMRIGESLRNAGVEFTSRHEHVLKCPRGKPRLTVSIDSSGHPAAVEPQSNSGEVVERWCPSNQKAFPTIPVEPVFIVPADPLKKLVNLYQKRDDPQDQEIKDLLYAMLDSAPLAWSEKFIRRLPRYLKAGMDLLDITGPPPSQAASLSEAAHRCQHIDPKAFGQHLREKIREGMITAPWAWADVFQGFMTSKTAAPSTEKKSGGPKLTGLVTLELEDWERFENLANSKKVFDWVSDRLRNIQVGPSGRLDAFGLPLVDAGSAMPKVQFPNGVSRLSWCVGSGE